MAKNKTETPKDNLDAFRQDSDPNPKYEADKDASMEDRYAKGLRIQAEQPHSTGNTLVTTVGEDGAYSQSYKEVPSEEKISQES